MTLSATRLQRHERSNAQRVSKTLVARTVRRADFGCFELPSVRASFYLISVTNRPTEPLDKLRGEVLALKVGDVHSLAQHDCIVSLIGGHENVRH
jgi:hypothetical protein